MNESGPDRVDTAPLVPGIYLIRIDADEIHENHKFIVAR